jgi:hypothetical protein
MMTVTTIPVALPAPVTHGSVAFLYRQLTVKNIMITIPNSELIGCLIVPNQPDRYKLCQKYVADIYFGLVRLRVRVVHFHSRILLHHFW